MEVCVCVRERADEVGIAVGGGGGGAKHTPVSCCCSFIFSRGHAKKPYTSTGFPLIDYISIPDADSVPILRSLGGLELILLGGKLVLMVGTL